MESIQPVRPPMSQQPPQRIDSDSPQSIPVSLESKSKEIQNDKLQTQNKANSNIPDVDISLAYKRKSLKHRIECGHRVKIGNEEINELKLILGSRQYSMYKNDTISSCVICDEQCVDGEFAVETVLFIPNKNDPAYDNLGRFRTELPRIACHECAAEYASINPSNNPSISSQQLSLGKVWQIYQNGQLNANLNIKSNAASNAAVLPPVAPGDGHGDIDDDHKQDHPVPVNVNNAVNPTEIQQNIEPQVVPTSDANVSAGDMAMSNDANKTTMPLSEAERDPFDDGFLICTQLVKTGGADQGGLQVGDVFVEFGHYSKKRFPGLKSIANLVRRSAAKEINVVVWRKLEQMNAVEDDGTGRTVFQKLALKLKPLQSHDADGGGVLGAVINTYPLPEMKN